MVSWPKEPGCIFSDLRGKCLRILRKWHYSQGWDNNFKHDTESLQLKEMRQCFITEKKVNSGQILVVKSRQNINFKSKSSVKNVMKVHTAYDIPKQKITLL